MADVELPDGWPSEGRVQFEDVSVRYDESLDPVLRNINLDIKPGEQVQWPSVCIMRVLSGLADTYAF